MELKDKLKEHRRKLRLSLEELASRSESSKSYLWELENRTDKKPSAEKLTKIAEVLGLTTEYLLDDKAEMDDGQLKEAFFRKFNKLEDDDKKRIEEMIDAWGKKK